MHVNDSTHHSNQAFLQQITALLQTRFFGLLVRGIKVRHYHYQINRCKKSWPFEQISSKKYWLSSFDWISPNQLQAVYNSASNPDSNRGPTITKDWQAHHVRVQPGSTWKCLLLTTVPRPIPSDSLTAITLRSTFPRRRKLGEKLRWIDGAVQLSDVHYRTHVQQTLCECFAQLHVSSSKVANGCSEIMLPCNPANIILVLIIDKKVFPSFG